MFRFTIRDVLWLTVVVALSAGWWNCDRSWQAWTRTAHQKGFEQVNRMDNRIYELESELFELKAQQAAAARRAGP